VAGYNWSSSAESPVAVAEAAEAVETAAEAVETAAEAVEAAAEAAAETVVGPASSPSAYTGSKHM
jgi:hypothetical protein